MFGESVDGIVNVVRVIVFAKNSYVSNHIRGTSSIVTQDVGLEFQLRHGSRPRAGRDWIEKARSNKSVHKSLCG